MASKKLLTRTNVNLGDGKMHGPDEEISVDEAIAETLIASGAAEEAKEGKKPEK